uniref:Methyltransferase domain-containing protein n=1 Tax=Candidatus Kentrum sp. DK TaxID=2126562 RepID=A0A450T6H8_9GAMM|nr:MAG: Methyltransferase domain-containing protein [Candidatus Kentron sp. DK]
MDKKIVALVQCTAGDLYPSRDPENYCIATCQRSGLFDHIVLAAPDRENSRIFDHLARDWDVAVHYGHEFDVAKRLLGTMNAHNADVGVRVLLRQFYLDTDQVQRMLATLQEQDADYVTLPPEYNYAMAADVFTRSALERVCQELDTMPQTFDTAAYQFSPWRLMEERPEDYRLAPQVASPQFPSERVAAIKSHLAGLIRENQVHFAWDFPSSAYAFVASYLSPDDRVLDIACGGGEGSRRLLENCREVLGADLDVEAITTASRRYADISGLSYVQADAQKYQSEQAFDAIVSLHTLEHLPQPARFLQRCRDNLRPSCLCQYL